MNKQATENDTVKQFALHLIGNVDACQVNSAVLRDIIGQDDARKKLVFFVDSHSNETPFPTMLFSGSQGLGKTFMAEKISKALGRRLIEVNCTTIETDKQFIEQILLERVIGDKPVTLLLDESHKLSSEVTNLLLSFLNPNSDNANSVNYKHLSIEYDLSKINVIFATTDAHKMFRPLVNRCEEIYFHTYNEDELYKILKLYLWDHTLKANKKDLALACRGRARDAFKLSQHIKRFCSMRDTNQLTKEGWSELKDIFGIYANGLSKQEVQLLKLIKDEGPISCRNLAIKMNVNENNIESEIEIRVKELGFIMSTSRGRCLTDEGEKYLLEN